MLAFLRSRLQFPKATSGLIWTAFAIVFVLCLVSYPQAVYLASKRGLITWWEIVFPALLPFFIGTELLIGFGVVRLMGVLLEPVMRPLFNQPGAASFVLATGFTSGFPIGSIITTQLYKDRLVTRSEGERLISFTNNASPLFMLAVVGVGMYHDTRLGILLAIAHYAANLTIGLLMGLSSHLLSKSSQQNCFKQNTALRSPFRILQAAFRELMVSHQDNYQPVGQRFSAAITKSINTLLLIGGFIIIFSVIIEVLNQLGLLGLLAQILALLLTGLGLNLELAPALATGLFEITLGIKQLAETAVPLQEKILITSFLLAWSGISVHAQVVGLVSGTGFRYLLFFCCRLGQALLAAGYAYLLYNPVTTMAPDSLPTFGPLPPNTTSLLTWWQQLGFFTQLFAYDLLVLLAIVLFILLLLCLARVKIICYKSK